MAAPSWFLLADLHFNTDNLDRNRTTFQWIVSEFERIQPSHVLILGDVVHTRGQIHLKTYHEIACFFRNLHGAAWAPVIHVLIGNHDMLDKHSRSINSMEIFGFTSPRLVVYDEITETVIDGVPCLFFPYHEDQTAITTRLNTYKPVDRERTVVFAHAALNGAIVNGISDHSNFICKNSLTVDLLGTYKQTFLGHFHHHRTYGEKHNVTYVGSPAQFNFGDAGDIRRGYVVYDPSTNVHTLTPSPYAEQFIRLRWDDMCGLDHTPPKEANQYKNKFIQIDIPASATADGTWNIEAQSKIQRSLRTNWAVARVQFAREVAVKLPRDEADETRPVIRSKQDTDYILTVLEDFLKSDLSAGASVRAERLNYITSLIKTHHSKAIENDEARLFVADIATLTMSNFMGVKGALTVNFNHITPGVWLIRGRNGTGKSTFLEAIAWCLYGETFRQCNAHDIVNIEADKVKRSCEVTIQFANGCVVSRSRKSGKHSLMFSRPNSTEIEERGVKSIGQAELDNLFNIGWKKFARSIMLSSSTTLNFTTSKEAEKRAVIEHLLGFDIFTTYTTLTETDMKQVREQLCELLLQTTRVEERTKSAVHRLADQEGSKRDYENEYWTSRARLVEYDKELARFDVKITALDAENTEKLERQKRARDALDDAYERQELAQAHFTASLDDLDTLRCELDHERESLLQSSQQRRNEIESDIRQLRFDMAEVQSEIDTYFSAFTKKCGELTIEECIIQDRMMHQRKIDLEATTIQNSMEKLAIIHSELDTLDRKRDSDALYRIEKAAERILGDLKEKDSSGIFKAELQQLNDEVVQSINQIRTASTAGDESRRIKLTDDVSAIHLSITRSRGVLSELGPSNPTVYEEYASIRTRSREFRHVDPEGFVAWSSVSNKKAALEDRKTTYENELHSLFQMQNRPLRFQPRVEQADKELALQRKQLMSIKQEIEKISTYLSSTKDETPLEDIRRQRSLIEVCIKEIEAVNTQLQRQIETVASNIDRSLQQKADLQKELDTLRCANAKLELRRAVIGFWKDNLKSTKSKGIRALFIEKKIHEINEEIERNMQILGDDGDGLVLDLGCELNSSLSLVEKKGTIPFVRRSDGQKKRCSLSLFFAILKKAKESGGFDPKFMFMDEVYDALDEPGQFAVHRWIQQNTSENRGEKTFVITHSQAVESLHKARVKGVIAATWDGNGTSYEVENDMQLNKATFVRSSCF